MQLAADQEGVVDLYISTEQEGVVDSYIRAEQEEDRVVLVGKPTEARVLGVHCY